MKCDVIAQGIIQAAKLVDLKIPLVVRLTGTNAKEGNELLANLQKTDARLKVVVAYDLDDAATKAVQTAKEFAARK
jgi:succinyl-CoA synthetase beta subunit